jgi:hypothetical protein
MPGIAECSDVMFIHQAAYLAIRADACISFSGNCLGQNISSTLGFQRYLQQQQRH